MVEESFIPIKRTLEREIKGCQGLLVTVDGQGLSREEHSC